MSILSDLIAEGHGSRIVRTRPSPNHRAPGAGAGARQGAKPADPNDQTLDIFKRANACNTRELLDRLGIEHGEDAGGKRLATCPGCHEPGAMVCSGGGLRCLHDRCASAGVPGKPGFRLNVDLVMLVLNLSKLQAAKKIFEWFSLTEESPFTGDAGEPKADDAKPEPKTKNANPFAGHHVALAGSLRLRTQTQPREFLLEHVALGHGVFPRSEVAFIAAAGGTGKSFIITQLGVAVASGGEWLGAFKAIRPGHVMLIFGEEGPAECNRRLYSAAKAAGLTDAQCDAAEKYIHLTTLHGVNWALTKKNDKGAIEETTAAAFLRAELAAPGVDWDLIVIDPLSRAAGGGFETDNESATRAIQILETFTTVRGNPVVLLTHHSSKASIGAGSNNMRGSQALTDGARSVFTLTSIKREADDEGREAIAGVRLHDDKRNYGPEGDEDICLMRNLGPETGGTLRLADMFERDALFGKSQKKKKAAKQNEAAVAAAGAELERAIRKAVASGVITSVNDICKAVGGAREKARLCAKAMIEAGEILTDTKIWALGTAR